MSKTITLSSYVERHVQKKSSLNFMSLVGFKASKIWFFFSENLLESKFSNSFQAKIIPWSRMFLDFLTEFHMVWKNQESCESWLVRCWVRRHSKKPKIEPAIFSLFLSCHYGFTNCFEILSFLFSTKNSFNMLNYLSRTSTSRNINLTSKIHKIQFFGLFG